MTRLNGTTFFLNPDIIESIEETPDTVIKLINEKKLIVKEKITDIVSEIIKYNRKIYIEKTRVG